MVLTRSCGRSRFFAKKITLSGYFQRVYDQAFEQGMFSYQQHCIYFNNTIVFP
jgi:hypothetical protein